MAEPLTKLVCSVHQKMQATVTSVHSTYNLRSVWQQICPDFSTSPTNMTDVSRVFECLHERILQSGWHLVGFVAKMKIKRDLLFISKARSKIGGQ